MNQRELLQLIDRYLEGKADEQEKELLHQHYESFQQGQEWNETLLGRKEAAESRILLRLKKSIRQRTVVVPLYQRWWIHVAAAVVLLVGALVNWYWQPGKPSTAAEKAARLPKHLASGRGVALKLSRTRVIWLDSAADGVLAEKEGVVVHKQGKTVIFRQNTLQGNHSIAVSPCAITTPGGSQYKVVLTDGTQVWLNAATDLRFPAFFTGNERKVEVTGEAYFEVAKDTRRPFRVFAAAATEGDNKGVLVEVLGTRFNINAYRDESLLKTTLLEGQVKIMATEDTSPDTTTSALLSPGQQGQFVAGSRGRKAIAVQAVDVDDAIAWKKNEFSFRAANIPEIMRQLVRWYNVAVVYEGRIPARTFTGTISRNTPLPTVLEILEQSDIHFLVKGQTITVKP